MACGVSSATRANAAGGAALVRRKLGVAHEELLELWRRWSERREEPRWRVTDVLPRVRRAPWDEDERARRRVELCIAELESVAPLQCVDQLVLIRVFMKRRAFPWGGLAPDRREDAAGGIGHRLERRYSPGGVLHRETLVRRNGKGLNEAVRHRLSVSGEQTLVNRRHRQRRPRNGRSHASTSLLCTGSNRSGRWRFCWSRKGTPQMVLRPRPISLPAARSPGGGESRRGREQRRRPCSRPEPRGARRAFPQPRGS